MHLLAPAVEQFLTSGVAWKIVTTEAKIIFAFPTPIDLCALKHNKKTK
jgi:hypothetical protein